MSADFGSRPTGIDWAGPGHGLVRFGEDSRLVVMFYLKSVKNEQKTKETGAPYHDNIIYVTMHEPGERLNIVDRAATDNDRARFPVQWSKYLQNKTQIPEGTPIDLLFPNNVALADNLKGYGIYTVQQCANLSSNAIDNIGMGAQDYVNIAKKYLESATSGVEFHKMREDISKEKQQNKILTGQVATLQAQMSALLDKMSNPAAASLTPPWIEGHDAAKERIDLNHPSAELAAKSKKKRNLDPGKESVELN